MTGARGQDLAAGGETEKPGQWGVGGRPLAIDGLYEVRSDVRACPVCGSEIATPAGSIFGTDGETYNLQSCPECSLQSLSNLPTEETTIQRYGQDYYSQNVALRPTSRSVAKRWLEASENRFARLLLHTISIGWLPRAPHPGMRMLDVGCGDGAAMTRASALGWEAEGCEVDDDACGQARAKGFRCYSGDWSFSLPSKSYDLVLMNHVLEHLPDPLGALESVRASMKDGGIMLLGLPNWDSSWSHAFGTAWWANLAPEHLWHFRIAHVQSILLRSGFSLERVRTRNVLTDVLSINHARAQWRAASAAGWTPASILFRYPSTACVAMLRWALQSGSVVGEGCMYTAECVAVAGDDWDAECG